jgi:hypothetical protein
MLTGAMSLIHVLFVQELERNGPSFNQMLRSETYLPVGMLLKAAMTAEWKATSTRKVSDDTRTH